MGVIPSMMHLGSDRTTGGDVRLPPKFLKKHVAFLGQTGSGKTVALKVFIEEAIRAGIPSVVMDPHGDLSQFGLPFVEDAEGMDKVDQDARMDFYSKVEVRIWTPVRSKGLPICLNPFVPPQEDPDTERMTASWDMMAAGFTGIAGFNLAKPEGVEVKSYLVTLLQLANLNEQLPSNFYELADLVEVPETLRKASGFTAVQFDSRVAELVTKSTREKLARRFRAQQTGVNHLLFTLGTPVDFDSMCTPCEPGKVPLNVIYMATLGTEDYKQTFMLEFCRRLYDWTIKQKSDGDETKMVFAIDEVHPYIPAHPYNPPSKDILGRLSAEARKFGVSCFFATQNIKKVDYKILGQAATICVGLYTSPQNVKAMRALLSMGTRDNSSLADELPKLKPGEFQLVNHEAFGEPQQLNVRWLYTPHGGAILNEDDIEKITPESLRKCVASLAKGKKMSGLIDGAEEYSEEENISTGGEPLAHEDLESLEDVSDQATSIDSTSITTAFMEPQSEKEEFEMNLVGGFSLFKDQKDELAVMLGFTNILTTFVLLWASWNIAEFALNNDSNTVPALFTLAISMLSAGVLFSELLANGEMSVIRTIRTRARPLQYLSLCWLWIMWFILRSGDLPLEELLTPLEVVQTMMTAFVILEMSHRIKLGKMEWPQGGSIATWAKGGLKSLTAVVKQTELNALRNTSHELLATFRLVMDGIVLVTLILLIGDMETLSYFSSDEWLVRVLSIYTLLFGSQLIVRWRNR
jgi:hypothetical protein